MKDNVMTLRNQAMKDEMEKFSLTVVGYLCEDCTAAFEVPPGTERKTCPQCGSDNLYSVMGPATKH